MSRVNKIMELVFDYGHQSSIELANSSNLARGINIVCEADASGSYKKVHEEVLALADEGNVIFKGIDDMPDEDLLEYCQKRFEKYPGVKIEVEDTIPF